MAPAGLEPARPFPELRILSPLRLPFRHGAATEGGSATLPPDLSQLTPPRDWIITGFRSSALVNSATASGASAHVWFAFGGPDGWQMSRGCFARNSALRCVRHPGTDDPLFDIAIERWGAGTHCRPPVCHPKPLRAKGGDVYSGSTLLHFYDRISPLAAAVGPARATRFSLPREAMRDVALR